MWPSPDAATIAEQSVKATASQKARSSALRSAARQISSQKPSHASSWRSASLANCAISEKRSRTSASSSASLVGKWR